VLFKDVVAFFDMFFRLTALLTIIVLDCAVPAASADNSSAVSRSVTQYTLNDIQLVRDDGEVVQLASELSDARPVIVNFIFTTCPGICPLSSQVFSQVQRRRGKDAGDVHLISISIDPENDTPAKLRAYARKFDAGPAWHHYTGTPAAIAAAEKAFGVYSRDKMDHAPVTWVRAASASSWVRLDGFATADVLIRELRGGADSGSPLKGR
jgi:protein SCO1